jgi:hypothetical protein
MGNDECTLIFCSSEEKETRLHSVMFLDDHDFYKVDPVHMKLTGKRE